MERMTLELARGLRERGLSLWGENVEYSTPRLKEIAKRQAELLEEFDKLDAEIFATESGALKENGES